MLYDLCTSESQVKFGDIILDEPPKVGCTVSFAGVAWRITGIKWMGSGGNNRGPSGLLCVERIDGGKK